MKPKPSIEKYPVENYIVRIYRRGEDDRGIAGRVEIVNNAREEAFSSYDDLWMILSREKRKNNIESAPGKRRKTEKGE